MEGSKDGRRRPKLDWSVLLPADEDDEHPPLLVVSSTQSASNCSNSHVDEKSTLEQSNVSDDLYKLSDRKLDEIINRMEGDLNTYSCKLPDGGMKLRIRCKCLKDERSRREFMRLQPIVMPSASHTFYHKNEEKIRQKFRGRVFSDSSGCETQSTTISGESHDVLQQNKSSTCNSMSRFGTIFSQKLDQSISKINECTDATMVGNEMSLLGCRGAHKTWSTENRSQKKTKKCRIPLRNFYSPCSKSLSPVSTINKNDRCSSLNKSSGSTSGNFKQKISPRSKKRHKKICKRSVELVDVVDSDLEDNTEEVANPSECFMDVKIYYPSQDDPEAVEIVYSDITCLEPESFLSSTIMNFYIRYLQQNASDVNGEGHNYQFFNTYFYQKLKEAVSCKNDKDIFFAKFRRWWKGISIFEKTYILIPINEDLHWSLVIVCILDKKDFKGPVILHLDSLGLHCSKSIFRHIKSYLNREWSYLNKETDPPNPPKRFWENLPIQIEEKKVPVPRQTNMYDCGLFVLFFIKQFIKIAPERLQQRDDLWRVEKKMFKAEEASSLRGEIRLLLQNIFRNSVSQNDASSS